MVPSSSDAARTRAPGSRTPLPCSTSRRSTTFPSASWRRCRVTPSGKRARRMRRYKRKKGSRLQGVCRERQVGGDGRMDSFNQMTLFSCTSSLLGFQHPWWDDFPPQAQSVASHRQQEPGQAQSYLNPPCTPLNTDERCGFELQFDTCTISKFSYCNSCMPSHE